MNTRKKTAIYYATDTLRKMRMANNYSQAEMADLLTLKTGKKISRIRIAHWENQERGMTAEIALKIANALNVGLLDLVEEKTPPYDMAESFEQDRLNGVD